MRFITSQDITVTEHDPFMKHGNGFESMLSESGFNSLLSVGEGFNVEFKQVLPNERKYLKTLVAFSNCLGGRMIIGVSDSGVFIGLDYDEAESVCEKVSSDIASFTDPQIMFDTNIMSLGDDGRYAVIVDVFEGRAKPYYLVEGSRRDCYIRQGRNTYPACEAIIRDLVLEGRNCSYDSFNYVGGTGPISPDEGDVERLMEPLRRSGMVDPSISDLINMGLITSIDGKMCITRGFDILTRNRDRHKLDCALFKGTDKIDVLDSKISEGGLLEQIDFCMRFIRMNLRCEYRIVDFVREEVYEIPLVAIREAVVNALVHRSYNINDSSVFVTILDDRVEVESPGLMRIPLEDVMMGLTKTRNRIIADYLHRIGYIENRGTGFRRMVRECRIQGLKDPLVEQVGENVRVTFFKGPKCDPTESLPNLGTRELDMLMLMIEDADISNSQLAERMGCSKVYISKMIRNAKNRGVLSRDETLRSGGWNVDSELLSRLSRRR